MTRLIDYIGALIFFAGILLVAGCIENLIWPGIILGLISACLGAGVGIYHEHKNEHKTQVH